MDYWRIGTQRAIPGGYACYVVFLPSFPFPMTKNTLCFNWRNALMCRLLTLPIVAAILLAGGCAKHVAEPAG